MRRVTYFVLILLTILLLAGLWWWTTSSGAPGAQVVRVGLYDNRPKVFHDAQGQPAGLFIELLQAMSEREPWRLEFVDCEWSDCLGLLEAGRIDIMPDVALNESRARRFEFHSIPVTHSWSGIWARKELSVKALPDLQGLRIAVLREAVQERALSRMMNGSDLNYKPVLVDSLAAGFEAVVVGEADAVISNSYFGSINGPKYDLDETPIVFNPASLYYAAPLGQNIALLERIDEYLQRWRHDTDSPYYAALKRAMVRPQKPVMSELVRWVIGAMIGLALLLFIMSLLLRWQVRRRTRELTIINHRFSHLLGTSPVVLYQLSVDKGYIEPLWISENLPRLFGYKPEDVFQPNWWRNTVHPDDMQMASKAREQVQKKGHKVQEYRIFDNQGHERYIRDEMQFLPGKKERQGEIVGSWSDLTEAHEQAEYLRYVTHHDPLTTLPNRRLLHERMEEALQRARESACAVAVLHIDLDRFKHINETLGYTAGDALLSAATQRIKGVLRAGDFLARVGGDEFILLLQESGAQHAAETARRLLQRFALPMAVEGHELIVTLSIGISLFPGDGREHETLLRHAEIALNAAKKQSRNNLHFFSSALSEGIRERLLLENDLRQAVERDELILHYQPLLDLQSGELVGAEALLRWQHPKLGLLSPDKFIHMAEQTGIIGQIGYWVLQQTCKQIAQWDGAGCHVPRVAVNLAVQQIEGGQLVRQIKQAMQEQGIHGERLELEVTESTIMREPDKATEAMIEFRQLGIKLAIDDFGTGYSSLAYLKRLPLDRLKIDRSFVMDIGEQSGSEAICRTIINLAHSLDLETVAEGVEEQHHADFLLGEGCDIAQGYLYSKPLPADELVEYCKVLVKSTEY